jgi:hypothetical protein
VPLPRTSFTRIDAIVCALILALCGLPFFLFEKAPDFVNDDVYYVDLADSLVHQHSYMANFAHERVQPPGLPVILAVICTTIGCTHDILTRSMSVFFALGLLLSYQLIRLQRGRLIAAASCLLTATAPNVFPWLTTRLWPTFPYFAITILIFLLIPKLETAKRVSSRVLLAVTLGFLLTAAVIVDSIGIALIAAILAWLFLSFFGNPGVAGLRLKYLLPAVLLALSVEVLWMQQGNNTRDWPLPGRGESYLAQLKLKSGNHPELGLASPKDVVYRIENNLNESTVFLDQALLRRWVGDSWTSPLIMGTLTLIVCGLLISLWGQNGQLCALYFIFYESIYLLWPWSNGVVRFAVPVLPLACLYLAEGALSLWKGGRRYPRKIGISFLPITLALACFAGVQNPSLSAGHGLLSKFSMIFWIACALLCALLIWRGKTISWGDSFPLRFFQKTTSLGRLSFTPVHILLTLAVIYLVAIGVAGEITMGRENLVSGYEKFQNGPEIRAAQWLQSHTDENVVIATRQEGLIYHYAKRKEIWFPPLTDPAILMRGILDHQISYLVVIHRKSSYYSPRETECFDLLNKVYPRAFQQVEKAGPLTIYEVRKAANQNTFNQPK